MQTYRLLKEDIEKCLQLETINERKAFYAKPVPILLSRCKKIVCEIFPRGGKTFMGLSCIKLLRNSKPTSRICVIVPSDIIKKEWLKHFEDNGITDIEIYSVMYYVKSETILKHYDLFIVDEVHKTLGNSVNYTKTIPSTTCTYFLGLSATLTEEMLTKLTNYGVVLNYNIPLETGYLLDVIPEYISYNIPVELTQSEKKEYVELQKSYSFYVDEFAKFDIDDTVQTILLCLEKKPFLYKGKLMSNKQLINTIAKHLNKSYGVVIGYATDFRRTMRSRSEILYKAKNKLELFYQLYDRLPVDEKKLIFTYKKEFANEIVEALPSSKAYHSGILKSAKKKVMDSFNNNEFANIVTCKSLDEGFTTRAKIAIRMFLDSTTSRMTQIMGRLLIKNEENPDEVATVYNFYVDDFEINNTLYYSQEKKWLKNSQKSMMFVKWVKSLKDIPFDNQLNLKL